MTVKFITVKGSENVGRSPFYIGVAQHERTMPKRETYEYCAERTGYKATAVRAVFMAAAELLGGGDYRLVVKSRAGDAAGPLQTSFRRVKYLRVEDPPPGPAPELERGYSEGEGHSDGQVFPYYAFILQGVNLDGAAVKIGYTEEGAYREVDVPDEKLTVTDTVITIASDSVELEDAIMSGSATVTFKVTTAGGTATYEAEVQS